MIEAARCNQVISQMRQLGIRIFDSAQLNKIQEATIKCKHNLRVCFNLGKLDIVITLEHICPCGGEFFISAEEECYASSSIVERAISPPQDNKAGAIKENCNDVYHGSSWPSKS